MMCVVVFCLLLEGTRFAIRSCALVIAEAFYANEICSEPVQEAGSATPTSAEIGCTTLSGDQEAGCATLTTAKIGCTTLSCVLTCPACGTSILRPTHPKSALALVGDVRLRHRLEIELVPSGAGTLGAPVAGMESKSPRTCDVLIPSVSDAWPLQTRLIDFLGYVFWEGPP